MGRPTDYRPEMCEQAEKWSWLGATNDKMAEFLNVSITTFKTWMATYPDFLAAVKKGREDADAAVVKSLYTRARGYTVREVTEDHTKKQATPGDITVDEEGELGQEYEVKPTVRVTIKEIPADPTSMIFWLKNRRPAEWRDKKDIDANVNGQIIFKFEQDAGNDPLPTDQQD